MAQVHERILAVMRAVKAIGKSQTNKFDHYDFRGIDDVYNVLGPAFAEHGVFVVPEVEEIRTDLLETAKGARMYRTIVRAKYTFHAEDGSSVSAVVVGEGADRGDKSANKAMSAAFKVAMFQALCIPTADQLDSESDSPEHAEGDATPPKPAPKKAPAKRGGDENAALISQYKRAAAARAVECGMQPKDGAIVLVDALRACGAEDASPQTLPGKVVQVCEREGGDKALSIAIQVWEASDSAPGFEGEAA